METHYFDVDGLEIEVLAIVSKGCPATREEPSEPASIEFCKNWIKVEGKKIDINSQTAEYFIEQIEDSLDDYIESDKEACELFGRTATEWTDTIY